MARKGTWVALALLALLIAACGDRGKNGATTMTFDASGSIVGVDFTDIGAKPDSGGFYHAGRTYSIVPGPGTIYWTDGISVWFADVNIQSGTQGEEPPALGMIPVDGEDGKERRYEYFLVPGSYSEDSFLLNASVQPAPHETFYGIRRP